MAIEVDKSPLIVCEQRSDMSDSVT